MNSSSHWNFFFFKHVALHSKTPKCPDSNYKMRGKKIQTLTNINFLNRRITFRSLCKIKMYNMFVTMFFKKSRKCVNLFLSHRKLIILLEHEPITPRNKMDLFIGCITCFFWFWLVGRHWFEMYNSTSFRTSNQVRDIVI